LLGPKVREAAFGLPFSCIKRDCIKRGEQDNDIPMTALPQAIAYSRQ
jgi:hypothetical protein